MSSDEFDRPIEVLAQPEPLLVTPGSATTTPPADVAPLVDVAPPADVAPLVDPQPQPEESTLAETVPRPVPLDEQSVESLVTAVERGAGTARRARELLEATPIVMVARNGKLSPAGEVALEIALRTLPVLFADAALDARLTALPFSTVRSNVLLKIRYSTDYKIRLGRRTGKTRLGPHPKRLSVEIEIAGKTKKFDCRTPKFKKSELPDGGLDNDAVWARTMDEFCAQMGKLLRHLGSSQS